MSKSYSKEEALKEMEEIKKIINLIHRRTDRRDRKEPDIFRAFYTLNKIDKIVKSMESKEKTETQIQDLYTEFDRLWELLLDIHMGYDIYTQRDYEDAIEKERKLRKNLEWSLRAEKDKMDLEKDQILLKYEDELEKWLKDRKNQEKQKMRKTTVKILYYHDLIKGTYFAGIGSMVLVCISNKKWGFASAVIGAGVLAYKGATYLDENIVKKISQ